MKKLLCIIVLSIQAHTGCDVATTAAQNEHNATQKVTQGIFSEQFIKAVVAFAKQSQVPAQELLCSTLRATDLTKEQLLQIKTEMQTICELYPQVIVLGLQIAQEKAQQLAHVMQKNFAQEIAQNKCIVDGEIAYVNAHAMNEEEINALHARMDKVLTPFEQEFDKSPLVLAHESMQNELAQAVNRCAALFPGIAQSFMTTIQANQEQLRMVGVMMLSALSSGVSDTIGKAIDERLAEINA